MTRMLTRRGCLTITGHAFLLCSLCCAQPAAEPWVHAHDPAERRHPEVVSVAFSPDGRRLAAGFFIAAANRPGTDWQAWTAQWNLETGQRRIYPNACGPVAFSADGQTLAMCVCERSGEDPARMVPVSRLALWAIDTDQPQRVVTEPAAGSSQPQRVLAACFHPQRRQLVAWTVGGTLLGWWLDRDEPPQTLAQTEPLPTHTPAGIGFTSRHELWVTPAVPLASPDSYDPSVMPGANWGEPLSELGYRLWSFNTDTMALWRPRGQHVCYGTGRPSGYLPAERYLCPAPNRPPGTETVAVSTRGKLALLSGNGEVVCAWPAGGGAVAFSADGSQLAVGGPRGIIRIWDVESGRLERALRLDDRPAETVVVAAIQFASTFAEPERNRKELASLITRSARRGASIIVLPETAVTGYMSQDLKQAWCAKDGTVSQGLTGVDPAEAAETVPGPSTRFFADLAAGLGIYVTVPLLEVDRKSGQHFNTVVLVDPDGAILLHYRKLNPWPYAERGWADKGDRGYAYVDTPYGRLALLICFDINFEPPVLRTKKVDILLYPIAWVDDEGSDWFEEGLPAVARDNDMAIVGANWTVPEQPDWHGCGQSRIIDRQGHILARPEADIGEDILYAELNLRDGEAGA